MRCNYCGAEIKAEAKFCPKCGTPVVKNQTSEPVIPEKKKKAKKPNKKWKIITACICCFAILVSGIIGGLYWRFGKSEYSADSNYVSLEEGFTDVKITDEASALDAIASVGDVLGISDADKELEIENVNTIDGESYYRFQQMYNGLPVYGRSVVISAYSDGTATALTSNTMAFDEKFVDTVSSEKVLGKVQEYYAELYEISDDNFSAKVAEMCYETLNREIHQAYRCYAEFTSKGKYYYRECFVDAKSIEIYFDTDALNYGEENLMLEGDFYGKQKVSVYTPDKNDEFYKKNTSLFSTNKDLYLSDSKRNILTFETVVTDEKFDLDFFGIKKYTAGNNNLLGWERTGTHDFGAETDTYINVQKTYDYFDKKLSHKSTDGEDQAVIMLESNHGIMSGDDNLYNNANSGSGITDSGEKVTVMRFGLPYYGQKYPTGSYLDVVAHEYTHGVVYFACKLGEGQSLQMSNAINEGYADILGYCVEAENSEDKNIDWIFGEKKRNAKEPIDTEIFDASKFESGKTDEHNGGGVISHAAYLMWNGIDGNEAMKIGNDSLAKLWYKALFMLQSNATFSQCRNAVELSARIMLKNGELTDKQYECVKNAFNTVGIDNCFATYSKTVKNDFELSVLSSDGTDNVNYNLAVYKMPEFKQGPGIVNGKPKKIIDSNEVSGNKKMHLDDGTYFVQIQDIAGKTKPIGIQIVVDGNNQNATDKITIKTDFADIWIVMLPDEPFGTPQQPVENDNAEKIYYEYIRNNLTLLNISKFPGDYARAGVFSVLIKDFDGNGKKEMVTFSITSNNAANQEYVILNLYKIVDGQVVDCDTSEEYFATGIGVFQNNMCATIDNNIIRLQYDCHESGFSVHVERYVSFKIKNDQLILQNDYSAYSNGRYEIEEYTEEVSGATYSSYTEFYNTAEGAGFDTDAHKHIGYGEGDFDFENEDYNTASCFKGNHIFTLINSSAAFIPGDYGFIYDNTDLNKKLGEMSHASQSNSNSSVTMESSTSPESTTSNVNNAPINEPISASFDSATGVLTIKGSGSLSEQVITWSSYSNSIKKIILDDRITQIGTWVFCGLENCTEIKMPANIKRIDNHAFKNCASLKSISFPNGLTSIGEEAFENCTSLEQIVLPDSLTSLGGRAFGGCQSAKVLSIGTGITVIPFSAFSDNFSLKSISIPNNVTQIESYAFSNCKKLKEVMLGDGVTKLGSWVFQGCSSLTNVIFGKGLKEICDYAVFGECVSLKNIVLPEGLTYIGQQTFRGCTSLISITIPKSLTKIGPYAFQDCNSLKDIYYKGTQSQWQALPKGGDYGNTESILKNVTVHCG